MTGKRETFKESYDCKCIKCGKTIPVKPSMMMTEFGMNEGCGTCTHCKSFLSLEITPDIFGEEMKSEIWNDFLKRKGLKA